MANNHKTGAQHYTDDNLPVGISQNFIQGHRPGSQSLSFRASLIRGLEAKKAKQKALESKKKVKKTWADLTDKEREYLQDQGHFGPHL